MFVFVCIHLRFIYVYGRASDLARSRSRVYMFFCVLFIYLFVCSFVR